MEQIVSSENAQIVTDGENYFLARSEINRPTWIWTKENLSKEKQAEASSAIVRYLRDGERTAFTCKKEFYDVLKADGFTPLTDSYFEMGAYYCPKPVRPKTAEGGVFSATEKDIETLANYYVNEKKETVNEYLSYADAEKQVRGEVERGVLYVWKNGEGKIVCTAVLNRVGRFVRINRVYTSPEERCRAYAKNLICFLTEKALREGSLPVLYTDYNYPASNRAYKAVGYVDLGYLVNFSCFRKDR